METPSCQKILEDAHDGAEREDAGHQFFHQFGIGLGQIVEQVLHLLAANQFMAMLFDDLADMGGHDRGAVNDGVAGNLGPFFFVFGDPDGRQAEGGFGGGDALDRFGYHAGIHGHVMAGQHLGLSDLDSFQRQGVLIGIELEIILDMDGRHDKAVVHGELFADGLDAGEQFTVLGGIDKGDQAVSDFQLQQIDIEHLFIVFGRPAWVLPAVLRHDFLRLRSVFLIQLPGHNCQGNGESMKREKGKAGNEGKDQEHAGDHPEGDGIAAELDLDVGAEITCLPRIG